MTKCEVLAERGNHRLVAHPLGFFVESSTSRPGVWRLVSMIYNRLESAVSEFDRLGGVADA